MSRPLFYETERLVLRDLEIGDKDRIKTWSSFDDPLLSGYNYSELTDFQREIWYIEKKGKFNSRYLALDQGEEKFIGYLGAKNIDFLNGSSFLGIVLNPDYVERGLGKEGLSAFLHIYFDIWDMEEMDLEVNDFNKRAKRLYENLGFKYLDTYEEYFENQDLSDDFLNDNYGSSFVKKKGAWYSINHLMVLFREDLIWT